MTLVSFKYKSGPIVTLVLDLSCHQSNASNNCILITSATRDDNQTHRITDVSMLTMSPKVLTVVVIQILEC